MLTIKIEIESKGDQVGICLGLEGKDEKPIVRYHAAILKGVIQATLDAFTAKSGNGYKAHGTSADILQKSFRKGLENENDV